MSHLVVPTHSLLGEVDYPCCLGEACHACGVEHKPSARLAYRWADDDDDDPETSHPC